MTLTLKMESQIRHIKPSRTEVAVLALVVPDEKTVLIISTQFKCLVSRTFDVIFVKFYSFLFILKYLQLKILDLLIFFAAVQSAVYKFLSIHLNLKCLAYM